FTERFQGTVQDSFVVGQEPELLANNGIESVPQRVEGDNIANYATITAHYDLTKLLSTDVGYENGYFDYRNHGTTILDLASGDYPSLAGTLNRFEHTAWLNLNWLVLPETTALVGVQYGQVDYIGNEPIALVPYAPGVVYSSVRNNRSYTGYLGVQEKFLPNLVFAANVGAQYTDYYNDPLSTTSLSPYVVASLTYTYAPGDYVQIGVNHMRNATDQVDPVTSNGSIALDQESTLVYGDINHYLTAKLLATLIGQVQFSTYNGGLYNSDSDTVYSLGLNFSYTFTPHFSADAGYNYDDVQSQVPGNGYGRNRVYVGVSAAY
ncbi:MAG TPA: outer membrane beta-barrel protein, partial [Verrucomicrobiae bacterium]|nr:outer membrane beta-barrel protein [Verrucomicrobiae bacterium]